MRKICSHLIDAPLLSFQMDQPPLPISHLQNMSVHDDVRMRASSAQHSPGGIIRILVNSRFTSRRYQTATARMSSQVSRIMPDQVPSTLTIQSTLSPADAEEAKAEAISKLEAVDPEKREIDFDIDGTALTPCAVQMVIATTRTAERLGIKLCATEQCGSVLSELQKN